MAERRAYAGAAMVLPISPSTATAVRRLGVPASRIEVVYPGVDVARLDRGDGDRDPGRLLFAGRLRPEKGALDAVAAMAELAARARRQVGERHSWEAVGARVAEVYRAVLAHG